MSISAVILAGGEARRMGGMDKGLIPFHGKPLIEHVIGRIAPQVDELLISANRNQAQYEQTGYPVISDQQDEFLGPLAGIARAMTCCNHPLLLVVPCDSPFLPFDLATRMLHTLQQQGVDICLAHDGERLQPLIALLHVHLLPSLRQVLTDKHLKVERWMTEHSHAIEKFDDPAAFRNINTPADLETAKTMAGHHTQ